MSQEGQTGQGIGPILWIIAVTVVLLALVYANVTGIIQISGAQLVSSNVATGIVVVLFVLTGLVLYALRQRE
jgi:membrane protein YdbS with pleckstrin-like domain